MKNSEQNALIESEHILATGTAQEYLYFTQNIEKFKNLEFLGTSIHKLIGSVSDCILHHPEGFAQCYERREKLLTVTEKHTQVLGGYFLKKFIASHPELEKINNIVPLVFKDPGDNIQLATLIFFASENNKNLEFIFSHYKPQRFDVVPATKLFVDNKEMYQQYLFWTQSVTAGTQDRHKRMISYFELPNNFQPYFKDYLKTISDEDLQPFSGPEIELEKSSRECERLNSHIITNLAHKKYKL